MITKKTSISNSNRPLILAVASFLILLILAFIGLKKPQLIGRMDTATMIFSFDRGRERAFRGPVTENMTILEAVLASAQGDDLKVTYYIDNKNNLQLASINNDSNIKNHQWNFSLNHVLANTEDINKIFVKSGDLVEAKYR